MIRVRALDDADETWKHAALARAWGSQHVARKGELVDAAALPGFVAVDGAERVGLLTYATRGDEMEIVTIHAEREGVGVGRALMDAGRARGVELGIRRIWLTTTNNNFRAFRFYQQWGMNLAALIPDGVTDSRRVKPAIPERDGNGVAIRHELEFEYILRE